MEKICRMTYVSQEKYAPYGVAYVPKGTDHSLLPPNGTRVQSWTCLHLELRDGAFADYPADNLGGRLCSEALREIIEHNRSPNDKVQWLETLVTIPGGESRRYHYLHFPVDYPVIDEKESLMHMGRVVKPVFAAEGVRGHEIFGLPGEFGVDAFVSARLKKLIERAKMTGVAFAKTRIT
ncbi:MAG: hypothetical protein MUC88_19495 [Planctomycetes bacterium]|jgi:hypothetical protein|nr:hypothetical protein [Planctomycetota bacterium]